MGDVAGVSQAVPDPSNNDVVTTSLAIGNAHFCFTLGLDFPIVGRGLGGCAATLGKSRDEPRANANAKLGLGGLFQAYHPENIILPACCAAHVVRIAASMMHNDDADSVPPQGQEPEFYWLPSICIVLF